MADWKVLKQKLFNVFLVKDKSDLIRPLTTLVYLDIVIGLLVAGLLIGAFIADHELIIRILILSIYIICPMAALDLMRHINLVVTEYENLELSQVDLNKIDQIWKMRTSKDVGLLWLLPPILASFFILGSFIDFCFYVNHEVENEPEGVCNAGCIVSIIGTIITGLMFLMTLSYIFFMGRVYQNLPSLKSLFSEEGEKKNDLFETLRRSREESKNRSQRAFSTTTQRHL